MTLQVNLENRYIDWRLDNTYQESTLHQISPYIGKMKPAFARSLILHYSKVNDIIYDPFCGSGSIALESICNNRNIIANDLNPYAFILTHSKLNYPTSCKTVIEEIHQISEIINKNKNGVDLRKVPKWVRIFFHNETLREIICWTTYLLENRKYFLLSCLLGILHHQRPGFLSYPSSHSVPYLRDKNFPPEDYPNLYQYRKLKPRLIKKVIRMLKKMPKNYKILSKICTNKNAATFKPRKKIDIIITSPPYMRKLDYGRDNRLRLWFVGKQDWKELDNTISPSESNFFTLMKNCFKTWKKVLIKNGLCVIVLGDNYSKKYGKLLSELVTSIALSDVGGYTVIDAFDDVIPNNRRVRRNCRGNLKETILILKK